MQKYIIQVKICFVLIVCLLMLTLKLHQEEALIIHRLQFIQ